MKKLLLMVLMSLALTPLLWAQSTVTGKITSSEDGSPIPGANILEKGTSNGAITDIDGNYRITVDQGATLVFSFIGFTTQEVVVGSQSSVNVTLDVDVQALDEVVVTAFGIEREKKALGYSVTQVEGKKFTESRAVNLGTALTGKIAGVNVNVPATGAAGQSRVVIRGGSSLSGDDQPLYVINGVPMDNTNQGAAGLWGGQDGGNGLSSLNPDDIESISVLKGMTAAALYGSRANNGVILITTKSGRAQDGITVDFNSNFTFDVPFDLSEWQNQYGHGTNGEKPLTQEGALSGGGFAWGDRLDGSNVIQFDGIERPYSDVGEDIRDFYDIGTTFTNTLGLSGGGENYNFRLSASLLDNEDIMPNAGFERQTYATNISGKLGRFTATVSGQYSEEDTKNRPRVSDTPGNGNFTALMRPSTISYDVLRGPTDKFGANEDGFERRSQGNTFSQNPYWAAYQFARNDQRNRLLGNMSLRWDALDWLYVQGRIGTDYQNRESEETEPYGTAYKPLGSFNTRNRTVQETNIDLLIGANQTFGDIGVEVLLGGNRMRRSNREIRIGGNELSVPFFSSVNNVAQQTYSFGFQEFGINSIFGQGTVSWRNSIFLNGTVRRDQFSQLNPDDNAVWYPSVGLSMILTEVLDLPSIFTFAKIRGSYAESGADGGVGFNELNQTFRLEGATHQGAALGELNGNRVPNPDIAAFSSSEIEFGLDLRMFNNRLGIDFAYYRRRTEDEILGLNISPTSGFNNTRINFAELENQGVELLLTGTPVQTGDFRWDVSFNMAYNISEAVNLGLDSEGNPVESIALDESRIRTGERVRHVLGERLGLVTGTTHMRINGQLVYDENGLPIEDPEFQILGEGRHPFSGGLTNEFTYKGWSLMALVDMRAGGSMFSGTNNLAYFFGFHEETLEGRETGITVSGVDMNGEALTVDIPAEEVDDYYQAIRGIPEYFVYDAGFGKLRELAIGYQIPRSFLSTIGVKSAKFSVVGRNLAILWSDVPNIDPESGYTHGNRAQGLEFFAVPTSRNIGFNLAVTF